LAADEFNKLRKDLSDLQEPVESVIAMQFVLALRAAEKIDGLESLSIREALGALITTDGPRRVGVLRHAEYMLADARLAVEKASDEYGTEKLKQLPYPDSISDKISEFRRLSQDFTIPREFQYTREIEADTADRTRQLELFRFEKWRSFAAVAKERLTRLARDLAVTMKRHELRPRPLLEFVLDWNYSDRRLRIEVLLSELEVYEEAAQSPDDDDNDDEQTGDAGPMSAPELYIDDGEYYLKANGHDPVKVPGVTGPRLLRHMLLCRSDEVKKVCSVVWPDDRPEKKTGPALTAAYSEVNKVLDQVHLPRLTAKKVDGGVRLLKWRRPPSWLPAESAENGA